MQPPMQPQPWGAPPMQPMHQPMPPHGMPQPPMGMQMAPPNAMQGGMRTVFGVPLEEGERVLYYQRNSQLGAQIFCILIGIPMILVLGLGIYFIYVGITHKTQATYAQAITNKRLLAMYGNGTLEWSIRWEQVRGLNKVTGKVYKFGVRDANGTKFLYNEDVATVERVITQLADTPKNLESWPEVRFDPQPT